MNNAAEMSTWSLVFSFFLVIIAIALNYKEKLGIGKTIIYSIARMIIQLIVVGYVLKYIFEVDNKIITLVLIIIMNLNAAYNASKRGKNISNSFKISTIAIFGGVFVSLIVLVLTGSIKFTSQQMIPVTGMLAGNSMNIVGLSYRNLNTSFRDNRQKIEERLALGADTKIASKEIMREAIKGSTQPTVDTVKTVGLVTLPGMMSGMMIGGVEPIMAIKYQIMVYFMIMATAMITAILTVYLATPEYFEDGRLL